MSNIDAKGTRRAQRLGLTAPAVAAGLDGRVTSSEFSCMKLDTVASLDGRSRSETLAGRPSVYVDSHARRLRRIS